MKPLQSFRLFTGVLSLTTALYAAQNPFEKADDDLYTGRFKGQDVTLSLNPDAGKWSGTLVFKGSSYSIQGEPRDGRLAGNFTDSSGEYPFSLLAESGRFKFTAGSFTATLERQKAVRLTGVYQSDRVKLDFKNKDGGINGTITFNGKEYEFSAKNASGDLEGMFKSGEDSFTFTLRVADDNLLFKTGTFAEVISLAERRAQEQRTALESAKREQLRTLRAELLPLPGQLLHNEKESWRCVSQLVGKHRITCEAEIVDRDWEWPGKECELTVTVRGTKDAPRLDLEYRDDAWNDKTYKTGSTDSVGDLVCDDFQKISRAQWPYKKQNHGVAWMVNFTRASVQVHCYGLDQSGNRGDDFASMKHGFCTLLVPRALDSPFDQLHRLLEERATIKTKIQTLRGKIEAAEK